MTTNNAVNLKSAGIVGYNGTGTFAANPATNHAVQVGASTSSTLTNLAVGADHSILMGNTGADPAFTTTGTPYVTGISFDTGTNTLNSYTVGTWTPAIIGSSSNPTPTYTSRVGGYIKIGRLVFCEFSIVLSALVGGSGNFRVSGLPFTEGSGAGASPYVTGVVADTLVRRMSMFVAGGGTFLDGLFINDTTNSAVTLPYTTLGTINGSFTYYTA